MVRKLFEWPSRVSRSRCSRTEWSSGGFAGHLHDMRALSISHVLAFIKSARLQGERGCQLFVRGVA